MTIHLHEIKAIIFLKQ